MRNEGAKRRREVRVERLPNDDDAERETPLHLRQRRRVLGPLHALSGPCVSVLYQRRGRVLGRRAVAVHVLIGSEGGFCGEGGPEPQRSALTCLSDRAVNVMSYVWSMAITVLARFGEPDFEAKRALVSSARHLVKTPRHCKRIPFRGVDTNGHIGGAGRARRGGDPAYNPATCSNSAGDSGGHPFPGREAVRICIFLMVGFKSLNGGLGLRYVMFTYPHMNVDRQAQPYAFLPSSRRSCRSSRNQRRRLSRDRLKQTQWQDKEGEVEAEAVDQTMVETVAMAE
ncbi:Protein of unknown function [Gryllus bimaculatus]|nr:Protein of unknown function [Gryllus bimaculatus]